ncbi:hypothetical protein [Neisseria sp. HMSC070F02]|uniref:hypothetical protein n=1 Tax=Neisseria sp. HMSC070F02 TaxID=1739463 RepID=UPI000A83EBE7
MIEMSKDYRNDLYDVYVSYPPQVDRGLIRECLRENLGEEKAEGLIESLDSKPQVLVEEKCTWAKREELHDYFSYLGLDIITRRYSGLTKTSTALCLALARRERFSKGAKHQVNRFRTICTVCGFVVLS